MNNTAVSYNSFGKPEEVLECKETLLNPIDESEVLIQLSYSPINPSDIGLISGSYGKKREL